MDKVIITLFLSLSFGTALAQTQDIEVLELHPAPGQFVNTLPKATVLLARWWLSKSDRESI